jgi:cytoskeletal protein CcmA (bactofilin family)
MWNKKDEQPPAPRPASIPSAPVAAPEIKKEPTPVSSTPFRTPESDPRSAASVGKSVKIVGQIFTKEDLYVDGDVEGTIESLENKVTVGPNGRVQASIRAREVIILGQVQGNVETSDKVDIRKDAKLVGDITTSRISIEDGALFKGSIDIKKAEPKVAAPAPAPPVARPAETYTAAATGAAGAVSAGGVKR